MTDEKTKVELQLAKRLCLLEISSSNFREILLNNIRNGKMPALVM
jgi:hypothetical protein